MMYASASIFLSCSGPSIFLSCIVPCVGAFRRQALGSAMIEAYLNDYFLHLIAQAPKANPKLESILQKTLLTFQWAADEGNLGGLHREISNQVMKVWTVCKGLMALLIPEVPCLSFCKLTEIIFPTIFLPT